jgi:hypothetical protein
MGRTVPSGCGQPYTYCVPGANDDGGGHAILVVKGRE